MIYFLPPSTLSKGNCFDIMIHMIIGFIFILAFAFYFSLISIGPVTVDCLQLAIKSKALLTTHHFPYLYGFGYPLMVMLGALFTWIGQSLGITDNVPAVNLISVLFGAFSVTVLYLLVLRLTNTLTALLASLLLLFNPILIDVSTYGIGHAPALCFLLLGLWQLVDFQRDRRTHSLAISALCFGLMGATRFQDLVLVLPFINLVYLVGLEPQAQRPSLGRWMLFILIISVVVILCHWPYLFNADYSTQLKDFWHLGLTTNFKGLFSIYLVFTFSYLSLALSVIGPVCYGLGVLLLMRSQQRQLLLTILWWVIPLGFYGNVMTSVPRFLTTFLPAFIIPISLLLAYFAQKKNKLLKVLSFVCLAVIIIGPLMATEATFVRRHHHSLIADFYQWVGQVTAPNAVVISTDDSPFVEYYAHRKTLIKPEAIGRHLPPQELEAFKKTVDQDLSKHIPVYMTGLCIGRYDDFREFLNLMEHHYRLKWVGRKPLELWYWTPFVPGLHLSGLLKINKR